MIESIRQLKYQVNEVIVNLKPILNLNLEDPDEIIETDEIFNDNDYIE